MAVVTTVPTGFDRQNVLVMHANDVGPEIHGIRDMATDSKGNLYFTDPEQGVIYIKHKQQGAVRIFAGKYGGGPYEEGRRLKAVFHYPSGLAIDTNDILYIADTENQVIRTIDVKNPDDEQTPVRLFMGIPYGNGDQEGVCYRYPDASDRPGVARFRSPGALAIHNSILYIADQFNYKIRIIRLTDAVPQTATLLGKRNNIGPTVEGPAVRVMMKRPAAIAVGSSGDSTVVFFTQYGDTNLWKLKDGHVSKVLLGDPHPDSGGIAINPVDNMLYYSAYETCQIMKVNISNGEHSVFAGTGDKAILDGPVATAKFAEPGWMTIANDGTIYVVDNNTLIRQIGVPGAVVPAQVAGRRRTRRVRRNRKQTRRRRA